MYTVYVFQATIILLTCLHRVRRKMRRRMQGKSLLIIEQTTITLWIIKAAMHHLTAQKLVIRRISLQRRRKRICRSHGKLWKYGCYVIDAFDRDAYASICRCVERYVKTAIWCLPAAPAWRMGRRSRRTWTCCSRTPTPGWVTCTIMQLIHGYAIAVFRRLVAV